jgi:hypothetical protein
MERGRSPIAHGERPSERARRARVERVALFPLTVFSLNRDTVEWLGEAGRGEEPSLVTTSVLDQRCHASSAVARLERAD